MEHHNSINVMMQQKNTDDDSSLPLITGLAAICSGSNDN